MAVYNRSHVRRHKVRNGWALPFIVAHSVPILPISENIHPCWPSVVLEEPSLLRKLPFSSSERQRTKRKASLS